VDHYVGIDKEIEAIGDAAAIIDIDVTDRPDAITDAESVIRRLLSVHDGIAYVGSHTWTSDDVRTGRMEDFEA